MNAVQWEKLTRNWTDIREVNVRKVVEFLIQKDVVDQEFNQILKSIPTDSKKVDYLLDKLRTLPERKNAYQCFLDSLKATELSCELELADKIDATHTYGDPSVRSKVNPEVVEPAVRDFLSKNFATVAGETTRIDEIQKVLEENGVFQGSTWSFKRIADIVCKCFVTEKFKRKVSPKSSIICFKDLTRIDPSTAEPPKTSCVPHKNEAIIQPTDSLTAAQLGKLLSKRFEEESLDTGYVEKMVQENLTGKILLSMKEDDIKNELPFLTVGHRMILKSIIREHRKQRQRQKTGLYTPFEILRQFGFPVKSTDCYVQDKQVDTTSNLRGMKTAPIRNFHFPEYRSEDDLRDYVLEHSAVFVSACINERRNGTIYFGISPKDSATARTGQVKGLKSLQFDDNLLLSMFLKSQKGVIKDTVSEMIKVPVCVSQSTESSTLFVIEYDVCPQNLQNYEEWIRLKIESLPHLKKKYRERDPVFKFSESGLPQPLTPDETCIQSKVPDSTIAKRKHDEQQKAGPSRQKLTQLQTHLTGGRFMIEEDISFFVMMSPFDHSSFNQSHFEFIKHLQPEVVFDFNPKGSSGEIYHELSDIQEEVMRLVTLDDFDERLKTKSDMENFQNDMTNNKYPSWVFCNGHGKIEKLDTVQWNKKRSECFRSAFKLFLSKCCESRVLIIICLMSSSSEYEVLLEACSDFLKQLPDQWVLLCQEQSRVDHWQKTLLGRNVVEKKDVENRCIIGVPWKQINDSIISWCQMESRLQCEIPHSSGSFVRVSERKEKEWNDIELVTLSDPIHPDDNESTVKARQKEAEEQFYRGKQVQWLNFFSHHVCQRKIHLDLYDKVHGALQGKLEEEERIIEVYLCHEPGAGGTTSARHILWALRDRYRCCVVRDITDQTVDQLVEVFFFYDENPRPILVLLDNEDEEKTFLLKANLKRISRTENITDTFCVLLICYRTVCVPIKDRKRTIVTLEQLLEKEEHAWFTEKSKDIEKNYENPKSLFSFNIFKENFDPEHTKNTVNEFFSQIKDKDEVDILKYVSLINHFDPDFKNIPVSCFDVFQSSESVFKFLSLNQGRKTSWETTVSQSFKFLLNLSSRYNHYMRERKVVRVSHKLTAKHILVSITDKFGLSVSGIVSCLLTPQIFDDAGERMKIFKNIISNMFKKRVFKIGDDGCLMREKFSPLILYLCDNEGSCIAGKLMEDLFDLNHDPFTAQQIARFYIEHKNYQMAEKYAKKATSMLGMNSYMWDTYAQVFKSQIVDKVKEGKESVDNGFAEKDVKKIIELFQHCVHLFEKEQTVSDQEVMTGNKEFNYAGFFGELRCITLVFSAIKRGNFFVSEENFHNFLVNSDFTSESNSLAFLSEEEIQFLKGLWKRVKETINKLDEKLLQMKVEIEANPIISVQEKHKRDLLSLRLTLNEYFGERGNEVPSNLSEEEECNYRRRMVFAKGASSLNGALQLKNNGEIDTLVCCYKLIQRNININHCQPSIEDLKNLLGIAIALLVGKSKRYDDGLNFQSLLRWSAELCRYCKRNDYIVLEAFLYFALLNFPTEERLCSSDLASAYDFKRNSTNWKNAFDKKHDTQRIIHRETTLFFLGNGEPLQDIVYQKQLKELMNGNENRSKWQSSQIRKVLRVMKGSLSEDGSFIVCSCKDKVGNEISIDIKTSTKIRKKAWLRKKIFFYLGFSFSGLQAYGMTDRNPMDQDPLQCNKLRVPATTSLFGIPAKIDKNVKSLSDLEKKETSLRKEIKRKKKKSQLCDDLTRELTLVCDDIARLVED